MSKKILANVAHMQYYLRKYDAVIPHVGKPKWNADWIIVLIMNSSSTNHASSEHEGFHYDDVIMSAIASQITSLTIVYSTVYPGADQSKHQSSTSLAFVWGIQQRPVNSPHKWPVTWKMFPFDDVIMLGNMTNMQYHPRMMPTTSILQVWWMKIKSLWSYCVN